MIPIIGLLVGVIIGILVPYHIPTQYSPYIAIAILAALDSVFGGITASFQGKFNIKMFISGFFGNAILAAMLTYIGKKLDVDIYLAAIIVFGTRLFHNFAIIRRFLLNKYLKSDNI
ncbi:MAG: small basic family protein [Firmicutes bacterium]|nr:small basic family protein [Bacillota bacterium]